MGAYQRLLGDMYWWVACGLCLAVCSISWTRVCLGPSMRCCSSLPSTRSQRPIISFPKTCRVATPTMQQPRYRGRQTLCAVSPTSATEYVGITLGHSRLRPPIPSSRPATRHSVSPSSQASDTSLSRSTSRRIMNVNYPDIANPRTTAPRPPGTQSLGRPTLLPAVGPLINSRKYLHLRSSAGM
ncbi:hypothetical protein C8Q70DRAFT_551617 [Cubamyces menziesii]|nr:hypothetical protein C8Q70DRAFT_551617 [Cubamyces menziesii]